MLGPLLIDVVSDPSLDRARAEAELEGRSGGRPTLLVIEDADIDRALLRAVEIANTATAAPIS